MNSRVMPKRSTHEMDLTKGPIFKQLLIYSIPLILTNIIQSLFNVADTTILGIFVNEHAVGAVGCTNSLINLCIGLFVGLSAGANVVMAKYVGAKNEQGAHRTVGTSIIVSLISGFFLMIVGVVFARTFLTWMGVSETLIGDATKYLQIYFMGMPIMLLYNFIASILRAVGDTTRPLIYLLIGGALNVGLNVFCILVLNLTVEGVAIATIASQVVTATLSIIALLRSKGYARIKAKNLRIHKTELKDIIRIGLPSGIQGVLFNIANVLVQTNVNAYGEIATSGNAISSQFDAFIYTTGNAIAIACMVFVSQNLGAGKIHRIRKVVGVAMLFSAVVTAVMGLAMFLASDLLIGIMANDVQVITFAKYRLTVLTLTYFLCPVMECFAFTMRALGKSITAMIISLVGICVFRILWVNTIYLLNPTPTMLFLVWPASWVVTIAIYLFFYFPLIKKLEKNIPLKIPPKQSEGGHIVVHNKDIPKKYKA